MMIAPAAGNGQIQLIPPAALEGPAVVLDRTLEHVERMGGSDRFIDMG
jgi:hypothetical protein